jgi:hypothetical protein
MCFECSKGKMPGHQHLDAASFRAAALCTFGRRQLRATCIHKGRSKHLYRYRVQSKEVPMGPWLVGVAFWLFLTAAAVTGIVADYKKRKLEIEPLRAAIERGQQLDPALIEKLMAREPRGQPVNPLDLRVGGIITIFAAIGIGLLALVSRWLGLTALLAGLPLSGITGGIALLAFCVGIGLLVAAARITHDRSG